MLRDVLSRHDRVRLPDDPALIQVSLSELAAWLCAVGVICFALGAGLIPG